MSGEKDSGVSVSAAAPHAEPKYTPGPWKMPGVFNMSDTYCTTATNALHGGKVATLTLCEDRGVSLANAHLIAAAPDLYEALKGLVHDIGEGIFGRDPYYAELADACLKKADAALQKAEGRQS